MTVDNSDLLAELLGNLEDKEAAAIWGPLAKELRDEEGDRPTYAKREDVKVRGTVLKVYQLPNFDKDGMDPAIDVQTAHGVKIVKFGSTVLRKAAIKALPQKGDEIEVIYAQKKTKGKYFDDKLAVLNREESNEIPF